MSKQELDVLQQSKGRLISMNSFLSTSLCRQKSLSFISSEHDDLCRVLFEIDVDPRSSYGAKPFANISSQSKFVNEQEILFMIATVFRLVDIHQENKITVIQMKLCNGNYDHDMELLLEHMQKESEAYDECLSLGHILHNAGMYDKAEQFYNRMLNELPNDHPKIASLWGSIGLVKRAKGQLEISFQWFNRSFKKYEQMGDRQGLARCLQNLANIHQTKGEFDQAINKYNQALKIFQELPGDQNTWVAKCFHNLGVIYTRQCRFTEAVQCYKDALNIRETILPHTHHEIGMTLLNMGNVCCANDDYDQALRYFERALGIFTISLPSEHPSIATIYCNMGVAYLLRSSDYQQSLVFLNRAASIYHSTLPPDHPNIHRCDNMIDCVIQKQTQ
ncbi:unnamed protein product [Rotaria sp. Silwood1]|nr:unnamed protein product [Rotaria sp. Silwood1]